VSEPLVLDLLAFPKTVPEARGAVREFLGGDACPDTELCLSELLANVIRHVGEGVPVTLRVGRTVDGDVRLELSDPDPYSWLVQRSPGGDEESGRGLLMVHAAARRWGVERRAGGKTVWCEVRAGAPAVSGRSGGCP
jgi:anti-sigma regulatory factor (Ser/Thr protein kinase)